VVRPVGDARFTHPSRRVAIAHVDVDVSGKTRTGGLDDRARQDTVHDPRRWAKTRRWPRRRFRNPAARGRLNPDTREDDDYVYVGDDWNDVGPSLAPSIVTACLGAFLFGYHSAVINAPLADIAEDLGFAGDNVAKGAIVSIMVVGGFAGGLGIGPFSDKEGRRAALVATTVPLALGT